MSANAEKNDLKQSLKTAKTVADEGLLQIRYKNPVVYPSSEEAFVGNWPASTENITEKALLKQDLKNASKTHPDHLVKPEHREITTVNSSEESYDNMAYFSPSTGKITLNKFEGEYKKELLDNEDLDSSTKNYIKGNPNVVYNTLLHETTHRDHFVLDGADSFGDSIYYNSRVNRLTETTATAVEYLAAAYQYTTAKNLGIETLQVNNKEEPVESIISPYSGLKEHIEKNGFDINNPESVQGVVTVASQYWHEERQFLYDSRILKGIEDFVSSPDNKNNYYNFSTMLTETSPERLAQKYETVSAEMLKDVYVGYNTTIDLTNCKNLLDTMDTNCSIFLESRLNKNETVISDHKKAEEILAINAHLEKLGLKTDDEKDEYMQTFLQNVTSRKGTVDEELKNILLSYNNKICYNDGLTSVHTPDKTIICGNNITVSIPNTPELTPTNEKIAPDKTPTQPELTSAQLAMLRAHNGR